MAYLRKKPRNIMPLGPQQQEHHERNAPIY